jgi:hypothetical protein
MRSPDSLALALLLGVAAGLGTASCGSSRSVAPSESEHAWFEEVAATRGLVFAHRSGHRDRFLLPEIMGGGAALFDMDGDGDLDVFLVQSGALGASGTGGAGHRLFRNRGDGTFEDTTPGSGVDAPGGYGMGVAVGDYDNDGDSDVYVTGFGRNVLLRNNGAGRFDDVTAAAGVVGSGWSTSAAFLDYDADGWLDLFVARYLDWSPASERECYSLTGIPDYCAPRNYDAPTSDLLFHNERNGRFRDVSKAAGLQAAVGNGLGVVAGDFTGDGRVDLFVANDATPNHFWVNQGAGRFVEQGLLAGVAIDLDGAPKAGMGVHAADVDEDGDEDLLVVNLDTESDSFFRNDGRFFVDATAAVNLRTASRRFTRFGAAFIDFDNDGRLDLYEASGRVGLQSERFGDDPYAEPNLLMRGAAPPRRADERALGTPGSDGRFEEVRPAGGVAAPLIATSRAAAFGDVDNDGGVDIVVANRDAAPHLLHNIVPARGHWVIFRAVDRHGRDALGAELRIVAGDRMLRRDVRAAYSYLASNDPRVHVGLGAIARVTSVEVRWPDGARETFGPFEVDRVVTLKQDRPGG